MKSWNDLEPDEYAIVPVHFTPGRGGNKINKVVIHHNGGNLSIQQCYNVWLTRQASAHYQVDANGSIGQLVHDVDTAWHAGDFGANQTSIGIEHADISSSPWRVSDATLDNGAHLVAAICKRYGLGRPQWGVNVFPHRQFSSTECPASLAGDQNAAYMAKAQAYYASMTGTSPAPAPAPAPAPEPAGGLAVDGWWGSATTTALQSVLGTPGDGIVSSQWTGRKGILAACTSGWEFTNDPKGSQLIAAMQRAMGIDDDGIAGPDFVNALEKRYGYNPDGRLDGPSNTVMRMQENLRKGKF